MSFYEFSEGKKLFNTVKAYPEIDFYIFDSKVYYQNKNLISGSNVNNLYGIPSGYISLYNINVDRKSVSTGRTIGPSAIPDTGLIYPFLIKDGTGLSFKTITKDEYNSPSFPFGSILTSSYNISSSIKRIFIKSTNIQDISNSNNSFINSYYLLNPTANREQILREVKPYLTSSRMNSLKIAMEDYCVMSSHFQLSSSQYGDKTLQDINLIEIPSIFYGSEIKKGTVNLKFYVTGTKVAELSDYKQNGELLQTSGTYSSSSNGKVAGLVLYKHGIILLTGSWDLTPETYDYGIEGGSNDEGKWIYWGAGCNDGSSGTNLTDISWVSSSYSIYMKGTNYIYTKTFLCDAPMGELNWSNNPTFLEEYNTTGSGIIKNDYLITFKNKNIKNINSSSIAQYSSSYDNITYINTVNLYDDMGNLIAIAKTSKPIKKTEDTDFTFKLKLDM